MMSEKNFQENFKKFDDLLSKAFINILNADEHLLRSKKENDQDKLTKAQNIRGSIAHTSIAIKHLTEALTELKLIVLTQNEGKI